MKLSDMFKKDSVVTKDVTSFINNDDAKKALVPKGLFKKCNMCKATLYVEEVKENSYMCPKCHGYFRMHARRRIESVVEPGTFTEWNTGIETSNPLDIKGYEDKIATLKEKTSLDEAVITGCGYIGANKVALAVCDGRFLMASMGYVVGEKITRMVEQATKDKLPVIIFACSGGARMQEGIVSLMQMAKTSAALKKHSDEGNLYISVLTDPTTGGVTASFAMLGDIILAEPQALIGFAGPRVIEQTIGQKLPKGFQRAEFLLEHGFIDAIVKRENMKNTLKDILDMHRISDSSVVKVDIKVADNAFSMINATRDVNATRDANATRGEDLTPWERVLISRRKDRPVGMDYIDNLFSNFIEFHGDRYYKDDSAIVGGIAMFRGIPVTVIAECKGKNTKDNIKRNFGMPLPEGYRKAIRLMKQAEKFKRPIICFVDTPGAFCGLEAEERGQGEAIARSLYEMSSLTVPVFSIIIGEGGSGGALAMAVSDEVWMLENSVYSILSPEGYASILWKDSSLAKDAAKIMKMTAEDLYNMNIIDGIISEPEKFTEDNMYIVTEQLKLVIENFIYRQSKKNSKEIVEDRYNRFRNM